jgi:putative spermidine/putrescine transport system ATP-binding protein
MFDEPLSNLDAKLRVDMRVEIRRLQQANGTTALYVTHDQEEAFSISDRVAIMKGGRIMQLDTPEVLYSQPASVFVANFVGFDNMIEMEVVAEAGDAVRAQMAGGSMIELSKSQFTVPSKKFLFAARPEGLSVAPVDSGVGIPATLGMRTYIGRAYQYHCETAGGAMIANGPQTNPFTSGNKATLVPQPEQCCLLPIEP